MRSEANPRIGLLRKPCDRGALTRDERLQLHHIGTRRDVAARFHTSEGTAAELMDPNGRVAVKTLAKVRAMLAEMRGEVLG